MKNMLNRILGFLALVIFVGLIAIFIVNLRQEQLSPSNSAGQSGYPPPENAIPQQLSYPGPSITTNQTSTPPPQDWVTYEGEPDLGFSFEYRQDFLLAANKYPNKAFGSARLIFPRVGASTILVLENPEQLALEDFLESEEFIGTKNFEWPNQWISTYADPLMIAGQPSLGFQSHRDLMGLFGAAGYVIFVPMGEYVIHCSLDGGGPTPDSGTQPYKASDEAIALTIQILNSLQMSDTP